MSKKKKAVQIFVYFKTNLYKKKKKTLKIKIKNTMKKKNRKNRNSLNRSGVFKIRKT
jgi:hypothetical protein